MSRLLRAACTASFECASGARCSARSRSNRLARSSLPGKRRLSLAKSSWWRLAEREVLLARDVVGVVGDVGRVIWSQ